MCALFYVEKRSAFVKHTTVGLKETVQIVRRFVQEGFQSAIFCEFSTPGEAM